MGGRCGDSKDGIQLEVGNHQRLTVCHCFAFCFLCLSCPFVYHLTVFHCVRTPPLLLLTSGRRIILTPPSPQVSLTSTRTAANSIYCPPHLQAALDLQSGIPYAEDKDYTTAYSYFFEALESLSSQGDDGALRALKYMLLCKVMLNLVSI